MLINNKRALAYTAPIAEVLPIPEADNIELAKVYGWTVIAKKGEFKQGDLCVFFEIDSRLPEKEWSEFLSNRNYKVKTMKLNKFNVVSQGLALPLSMFKDEKIPNEPLVDLTKTLGVKYITTQDNIRKDNKNLSYSELKMKYKQKYGKFYSKKLVKTLMKRELTGKLLIFLSRCYEIVLDRKDKRFPTHFSFISKTDEERVENLVPNILTDKRVLTATEKLDGTSTTFILERKSFNRTEFYILSRNVRMLSKDQDCYHSENIYWEMAEKYDVKNKLKEYLNNHKELRYVCIQGESVGNVQGNPLKLKENDFFGYNFIRSDVGRVPTLEAKEIAEKMGMKWVPIISTDWVNPDTLEEMKQLATGKSILNPEVYREGIVYRDEKDNTFSFKNVSNEYLLKHNL